jgi:hypothetical protein
VSCEVVRGGRALQRPDRDAARSHEREHGLVEREHAVVAALGDHLVDLVGLLRIGDPLGDPPGVHQHLETGASVPSVVGASLADDATERAARA